MSIPPPPPKVTPLVPGRMLDRYELLCPIAQGGMASVWVARIRGKHGFKKLVAIKTILPHFASDASFRNMFLDEAHIAAGIEHRNVTQVLDLGEEDEVLYLAMEWVEGDALSKLHRACEKVGERIPVPILLRIMADACAGLHAAHELRDKDGHLLNVVHRDVSPQNILVTTGGVAKIIDFGIAKARDRVGGDTATGILKGKVEYMAPEQALGKPIDRRADVWAIGAILYYLFSGAHPYKAETQLATLHLMTSGKPIAPLPDSIPEPVVAVVNGALSHDLDARFATCADVERAIESAMAKCGLIATSSDVAAFVTERLRERGETRKAAIELALNAAAERERMAQLLKPSSTESGAYTLGTFADPSLLQHASAGSEAPTIAARVEPITSVSTSYQPTNQRKRVGVFAGVAAAAAVLVVVAALTFRKDPAPGVPATASTPVVTPPAPASASALPSAAVVEASSASATVSAVAPKPSVVAPVPKATVKAPPTVQKPKRKDDGF